MACRRTCVSASAISGAVATRVWPSSDNCEAAIKAGRFVWAIWLKLAPNRVIARTATPLCVTAKMPMRASPIRMVSATLFRRVIARPPDGDSPARPAEAQRASARRVKSRLRVRWPLRLRMLSGNPCAPLLMGRWEVVQHVIRRKLVAHDRGVADLAELREVYRAPIDFADLGKAPRDRQIECAHGDLQAHVFFREVAAVVVVAENDHRPCAEKEVAAMGHNHLAFQDSLDASLAPVKPAHHHIDAGLVSGLAQGRDRAQGHRIVGRPQRVDAWALFQELAHPHF